MNVTKEQFIKLAIENLFVLEGERNGSCSIYGIEQLYEAVKEYKPKNYGAENNTKNTRM